MRFQCARVVGVRTIRVVGVPTTSTAQVLLSALAKETVTAVVCLVTNATFFSTAVAAVVAGMWRWRRSGRRSRRWSGRISHHRTSVPTVASLVVVVAAVTTVPATSTAPVPGGALATVCVCPILILHTNTTIYRACVRTVIAGVRRGRLGGR